MSFKVLLNTTSTPNYDQFTPSNPTIKDETFSAFHQLNGLYYWKGSSPHKHLLALIWITSHVYILPKWQTRQNYHFTLTTEDKITIDHYHNKMQLLLLILKWGNSTTHFLPHKHKPSPTNPKTIISNTSGRALPEFYTSHVTLASSFLTVQAFSKIPHWGVNSWKVFNQNTRLPKNTTLP